MTFDPLSQTPPTDRPWGINYGGGTNSKALVVECFRRGLRPDWICFADTGSERPHTYESNKEIRLWLEERAWTPLSVTRWIRERPLEDGRVVESLEENCLRTKYMPSATYGYAGCSTKFKRQPMEKWRALNAIEGTVFCLGYDFGEHRRVKKACERPDAEGESPWYPLYAWGITRGRCDQIVRDAGLTPAKKSSCFFCPQQDDNEWFAMKREEPELFARALAIEALAEASGNAREFGLRRSNGYLRNLGDQTSMFSAPQAACTPIACDCFEAVE